VTAHVGVWRRPLVTQLFARLVNSVSVTAGVVEAEFAHSRHWLLAHLEMELFAHLVKELLVTAGVGECAHLVQYWLFAHLVNDLSVMTDVGELANLPTSRPQYCVSSYHVLLASGCNKFGEVLHTSKASIV
jgi:hypothetical protein